MFRGFESWGVLDLQELTDWLLDPRAVASGFSKQGHLERYGFYNCLKTGGIELLDIL